MGASTGGNRGTRALLEPTITDELSSESLRVLATLPRWWERRAAEAGLSGRWSRVAEVVAAVCPVPGFESFQSVIRDDLLDATAEELGNAYVLSLPDDRRDRTGRHYTPPVLAQALWEQAAATLGVTAPDGLVYDRACGAGALLLPPLRAWLAAQAGVAAERVVRDVAGTVGGRDLDAGAVWVGNVLLAAELLPTLARVPEHRREPLPSLLQVGDGLADDVPQARVSILNPPYGRVRLSETDRMRWKHLLSGHANRYGLFMGVAAQHTERGGVVAALVPTSWLGGSYFRQLRAYLGRAAPLQRILYVQDRSGVFTTGVLQETVLASFKVGGRAGPVSCERITINGRPVREVIGAQPLAQDDVPWLLPRAPVDAPLVTTAAAMTHRLADYGWSVSTGPLVWNRRKDALSAQPRPGSIRVVWAGDLDGGALSPDPARHEMRYCLVRPGERETLVLDSPAVLLQRTTAPEQPRRLIAVTLGEDMLTEWGGEVVVENHVNVLTCSNPDSVLTTWLLTVLLASEPLDRLYRCLTGTVAVSAYELNALPLPGPEVLLHWSTLDPDVLAKEVRRVYGLRT